MAVEMTYVALKPLRVGGKRREAGQLVPEAADWPRRSAWIDQGRIAAVPKTMVDAEDLAVAERAYAERIESKMQEEAAPDEAGETEDSNEGEGSGDETDVVDLSTEETESDDSEVLTRDQALELSKQELRQIADERDIEVDGRWSVEKLVQVLFDEEGGQEE